MGVFGKASGPTSKVPSPLPSSSIMSTLPVSEPKAHTEKRERADGEAAVGHEAYTVEQGREEERAVTSEPAKRKRASEVVELASGTSETASLLAVSESPRAPSASTGLSMGSSMEHTSGHTDEHASDPVSWPCTSCSFEVSKVITTTIPPHRHVTPNNTAAAHHNEPHAPTEPRAIGNMRDMRDPETGGVLSPSRPSGQTDVHGGEFSQGPVQGQGGQALGAPDAEPKQDRDLRARICAKCRRVGCSTSAGVGHCRAARAWREFSARGLSRWRASHGKANTSPSQRGCFMATVL